MLPWFNQVQTHWKVAPSRKFQNWYYTGTPESEYIAYQLYTSRCICRGVKNKKLNVNRD